MRQIAVQIVEDHPAIQIAISRSLSDRNYRVTTTSTSVTHAFNESRSKPIDLVILDLGLPGLTGETLLKQYQQFRPQTPVLIYSATSNLKKPSRCIKNGARGFVRKSAPIEEFLHGVDTVALRKERYIPDCLRDQLLLDAESKSQKKLTPREQDMVRLIALGRTSRQIATALQISERTVNIHRSNMMRKIDAHKASEVTVYALTSGYISYEEVPTGTLLSEYIE